MFTLLVSRSNSVYALRPNVSALCSNDNDISQLVSNELSANMRFKTAARI